MPVAFQADADLNHDILRGLLIREPDIDFRSAAEAGLLGASDPDVLRRAAEARRILVSHDTRTMPHHFGDFLRESERPGLILIPQRYPVGKAVRDLLLIWTATEPEDWKNQITRLPI